MGSILGFLWGCIVIFLKWIIGMWCAFILFFMGVIALGVLAYFKEKLKRRYLFIKDKRKEKKNEGRHTSG